MRSQNLHSTAIAILLGIAVGAAETQQTLELIFDTITDRSALNNVLPERQQKIGNNIITANDSTPSSIGGSSATRSGFDRNGDSDIIGRRNNNKNSTISNLNSEGTKTSIFFATEGYKVISAESTTTDEPTSAAVIVAILTTVLLCFIDGVGILLNSRIINSWKWSFSRTPTGGAMRAALMLLLCLATSIRIISNIIVLTRFPVSMSELYPGQSEASLPEAVLRHEWCRTLLLTAPTLLFLSMYGLIVQFWAQVYYAATLYSFPLLKPAFLLANCCLYLTYIITAATYHFGYRVGIFQFLISVCFEATFCLLIVGFIYFGAKVVRQLLRCRPVPPKRSVQRVLLLAIFCPLLFAPRAFHFFTFYLLSRSPSTGRHSLTAVDRYSHLMINSLEILTSEALPAICILIAFWSYNTKSESIGTHDVSPAVAPPWGAVPVLMTRLQDSSGVTAPLLQQRDLAGVHGIGHAQRHSGYQHGNVDHIFIQQPVVN
eukprot:Lankesteria_metandrocarpae@DN5352_c2_g3_i3.p1